jgi:hypothetical protein
MEYSPYSPGAGRHPAALVGRDKEAKLWNDTLQRLEYDSGAQPIALYGLRGVGKTVLLNHLAQLARDRGWLVVKIEAKSSLTLRELLVPRLYPELKNIAKPKASQKILKALKTALSFKATLSDSGNWQFGLDLTNADGGAADTGLIDSDLTELIRDLSAAYAEKDTGFAILIDEAQDLRPEDLEAICTAMHDAAQENDRVALAVSGLPNLHVKLAEAKSYSERLFHFIHIDSLQEEEARSALNLPAAKRNVYWTSEALSVVVTEAGGYPYFLQQFGEETWLAAPEGRSIEIDSAENGIHTGRKKLDEGFFKTRWDRATNAEKEFMKAMSIDGNAGSRTSEIALRLKKPPQGIGPQRAGLIGKGLIYAPETGVVQFTVPSMADFIQRQVIDDTL